MSRLLIQAGEGGTSTAEAELAGCSPGSSANHESAVALWFKSRANTKWSV